MKLDRNTNRGGRGKYALVNMRKLIPILEDVEATQGSESIAHARAAMVKAAFELLVSKGIISLGNETPGDQFFVMKYKDQFTEAGLRGYADAIRDYLRRRPITAEQQRIGSEMNEYMMQLEIEIESAGKLGNRIPD